MAATAGSPEAQPPEHGRHGFWATLTDQFGFRQLVSDYLIPVETNSLSSIRYRAARARGHAGSPPSQPP